MIRCLPTSASSVPPPTSPFILPLIRLCPLFCRPRFLPRVYLVPSPLITRRWANPNTIINAVASVFIPIANSPFFETMPHARFEPPFFKVENTAIRNAVSSKTPSSLSISRTTVLISIACVPRSVNLRNEKQRREGRGGWRLSVTKERGFAEV